MKKPILSFFIVLFSLPVLAQQGGNNTYEFLNLTVPPRAVALGGNFLSVYDHDINLVVANPSLITPKIHNHLTMNFTDYFAGVNTGFVSYSRTYKKPGSLNAFLQFINYGNFKEADETGQLYGNFSAGEYALGIGWGRALDSLFTIGANFKTIFSFLESYTSFGLAVDVAGTYHDDSRRISTSLIFRNIGRQIKSYTGSQVEPLPFEIQLGFSKRLEHVPLRIYVLAKHLEQWDLTYESPLEAESSKDPITGEPIEKGKLEKFADNAMRHFVVGGEFSPSKNISFRLGYDYQRRKELRVPSKISTIGFSWGLGIKIKKFNFNYARSTYHLSGSPNYISLTTNLDDFGGH